MKYTNFPNRTLVTVLLPSVLAILPVLLSSPAEWIEQRAIAAKPHNPPVPTRDPKKTHSAVPHKHDTGESTKDPSVETSAAETPKVWRDLSFLHGTWASTSKSGAYVEEYWSAFRGDGMVGHCRFIKDGKTTFYELLAIVKLAGNVVLRMKHLNGDFVSWSDKEEAGNCKLISSTPAEAVFDNGLKEHHVKVTYKKIDAKTMHVEVDDTQDGKTSNFPFEYKLLE